MKRSITAAEQAASAFIKSQVGARDGLVAFAGTAVVLVLPTGDTNELLSVLRLIIPSGHRHRRGHCDLARRHRHVDPSVTPTGATVSLTGYADDVIVVLTDGSNNRGIYLQTAAKEAAGLGRARLHDRLRHRQPRAAGSSDQFGGFGGGGGGGFGGWRGFGGGRGAVDPVDADDGALMQISRTTGGRSYRAQDALPATALARLPAAFTIVRKHIDVASWFAARGGLLIAAAVALSLVVEPHPANARPHEDRGLLNPGGRGVGVDQGGDGRITAQLVQATAAKVARYCRPGCSARR